MADTYKAQLIKGKTYDVMDHVFTLEANVEKNKAEVNVMGRCMAGHKTTGGKWNMNSHILQSYIPLCAVNAEICEKGRRSIYPRCTLFSMTNLLAVELACHFVRCEL
ncbi:Phage-like element PBSX protein XkdM [Bacillus paralicheniformis]|nr:phage-like element PBSX protein xkdM [Bacillus paralicheniformis]TWJ60473.1 Phage-like element PBSX protein XkdM [Bacillus paralicheniformis]BCE06653.1 hypothetical protein RSC1_02810 [Bacillus paralicheniformis]BCE08446.1 hypothetical protein RSC2_00242 [Bacillus paralicheniformis]BCE14536.1 hypothetical protein RSC3_01892 [Bacillus paralicheniformis]